MSARHLLTVLLSLSLILAACNSISVAPTATPQPVIATPTVAPTSAATSNGIEGVETFADIPAAQHVAGPVSYPQTPPIGGPHSAIWQNCGIYDQPVPNEQAVHSLEHGTVWITYRPDLAAADVSALRDLVRGKSFALLSPYPDLPAPVVASAWGLQLKVDSATDPRLAQFLTQYHNGPQNPEPGAPCSGAAGEPIE